MTTVRKNGKEFKSVIKNMKKIFLYSLSNNFSGDLINNINELYFENSRMTKNNDVYTLHVHSNLWYKIEVK